jgi:ribosomal protein L11 methyltransferase
VKLGARQVVAVDIDAESLENARLNAAINGMQEGIVFGQGSVQEVLAGDLGMRSAQVVVANILAPVLIRLLAAGLADLVADEGALILGGILVDQSPGVVAAAESAGLALSDTLQKEDWIALSFSRAGAR